MHTTPSPEQKIKNKNKNKKNKNHHKKIKKNEKNKITTPRNQGHRRPLYICVQPTAKTQDIKGTQTPAPPNEQHQDHRRTKK